MSAIHPIRKSRDDQGLTLDEAGERIGVTGTTVWRWENGRRAPRRRDIPRIAEALGIDPGEIAIFGFQKEAAK